MKISDASLNTAIIIPIIVIEIVSMYMWKQGLKINYSKALTAAIVGIMFWKVEEGQIFDKKLIKWNLYGKICCSIIGKYSHTSTHTYMCE